MPETTQPVALPVLAPKSMDAFERYLERKPLNDELAEILAGNAEGDEPVHPAEKADGAAAQGAEKEPRRGLRDWTPTRKQAAALAETVQSDGWAVFLALMKKRLEILRETAISVSSNDPLRNKDTIAEEWAYHGLYRKVLNEMQPMVQEQLERLKGTE